MRTMARKSVNRKYNIKIKKTSLYSLNKTATNVRGIVFHSEYSLVCNSLSLFRGNFSKSLNFSEGNLPRFDQRFSINHLKREDNCFVYSKHPPFSFRAMLCLWDNSNCC